jgi:hypothetical protein
MFELLMGFAAGLVVGWNFLPQPAWIKNLFKGKTTINVNVGSNTTSNTA